MIKVETEDNLIFLISSSKVATLTKEEVEQLITELQSAIWSSDDE